MINYDNVRKKNINEHTPNGPQIPDHPYRILTIRGYGSRKVNARLNLIKLSINKYGIIDKFIYKLRTQIKQNIKILL